MDNLTPKAIVAALDDHIIGQKDAKRAVAVALRTRWRRQRLGPELRDEVEASPQARLFKTLGCSTCAVERAPIEPHLRAREVPRVVNITILHVRDDAEPHAAVAPRVQSLRDG